MPVTDLPCSGVAVVTGASRGIGKAVAVALAELGYDVAVMARTLDAPMVRDYSPTVNTTDARVLPGTLRATADLVERAGRRALAVPLDVLEPDTIAPAVRQVMDTWGRIDVLVNNARYVGPGHLDVFLETPIELIRTQVEANLLAPLRMLQHVLPVMVAQGGGVVINITSAAALSGPPAPADQGGWGLGYAVSKGGFHRIAPVLAVELGSKGITSYNVEPGFVATERNVIAMADHGVDASAGAPPELVGAAVADLVARATRGDSPANGSTVFVQSQS